MVPQATLTAVTPVGNSHNKNMVKGETVKNVKP